MTDELEFWDDCYAKGKTGWDRGEVHPALLRWREMHELTTPCSIIVPGCGRGYEVVELAKHGFDVTAVEIATEPVEHLRKQLADYKGNALVVQESIFDFQPSEPVDVVYEQTCLCAIEPDQRADYERAVLGWLKPGGELLALFVQKPENPDHGPPYHCDLENMKMTFPESRWNWLTEVGPAKFNHPSGKLVELAHVLKRRR